MDHRYRIHKTWDIWTWKGLTHVPVNQSIKSMHYHIFLVQAWEKKLYLRCRFIYCQLQFILPSKTRLRNAVIVISSLWIRPHHSTLYSAIVSYVSICAINLVCMTLFSLVHISLFYYTQTNYHINLYAAG